MGNKAVNKPKPNGRCYCCDHQKWWWRPSGNSGDWLCGVCHPNPCPETYMEPEYPAITPPTQAPILKADSAGAFETQVGEEKATISVAQRGLERVEAQERPVPPYNPGILPSTQAPSLKADSAGAFETQVGEEKATISIAQRGLEQVRPRESAVVFRRTEENIALLKRVKEGNLKLIKAWPQIIRNPSNTEFAILSERFYQAKAKLEGLCQELQVRGYRDCLYMENGVKTQRCDGWPDCQLCKVCPSDIDYFAAELFGGEPPVRHHSEKAKKQGEMIMEFLKTLGGKI